MKALTLTQPWATLVAHGDKQVETRSWRTNYRGLMAIHAAKTQSTQVRSRCTTEPLRSALAAVGITDVTALPRGAVVAVCRLVDCLPTDAFTPVGVERLFGDYGPGRFAWLLADIQPLRRPVPASGQFGLWETGEELEAAIREFTL